MVKRRLLRNAECHPEKSYHAKGLCKPCYYEQYHKTTKPRRKTWKSYNRTRATKEQELKYNLKRYGLTPEQYHELVKAQKGCCAICGNSQLTKRLHVDHDHQTGEIRGLLCSNCNRALGLLGDDLKNLEKAVQYLRR